MHNTQMQVNRSMQIQCLHIQKQENTYRSTRTHRKACIYTHKQHNHYVYISTCTHQHEYSGHGHRCLRKCTGGFGLCCPVVVQCPGRLGTPWRERDSSISKGEQWCTCVQVRCACLVRRETGTMHPMRHQRSLGATIRPFLSERSRVRRICNFYTGGEGMCLHILSLHSGLAHVQARVHWPEISSGFASPTLLREVAFPGPTVTPK